MFAKIYGDDDNQILVKIDQSHDDCVPEVRIFFKPNENLGVCSLVIKFEDSPKGWDAAENVFHNFDELKATALVDAQRAGLDEFF